MASVYVCEYFMCISSGVLITEYIWLGIIFEHVKFRVNRFTNSAPRVIDILFLSECTRVNLGGTLTYSLIHVLADN